jgi:hypothetical protein
MSHIGSLEFSWWGAGAVVATCVLMVVGVWLARFIGDRRLISRVVDEEVEKARKRGDLPRHCPVCGLWTYNGDRCDSCLKRKEPSDGK